MSNISRGALAGLIILASKQSYDGVTVMALLGFSLLFVFGDSVEKNMEKNNHD